MPEVFAKILVVFALCPAVVLLSASGCDRSQIPQKQTAPTDKLAPAAKGKTTDEHLDRLTLTNIETGRPAETAALFNHETNRFTWKPGPNDSGRYRVKITAQSEAKTQQEIVTITVNDADAAQ